MNRHSLFSLASLLALTVAAPGCTERAVPEDELDPRLLYDFESCDDLLSYAKSNAKTMVEQSGNIWGYPGYDSGFDEAAGGEGGDSGGDPLGEPQDGGGDDNGGGGGKDFSETNVQEVGVDEPDLIKTDGERVLALAQGKLHFVDVSGVSPQLRGSLMIDGDAYDPQMFLHEDRAMILLRTGLYNYGYGYEGGGGGVGEPIPIPEGGADDGGGGADEEGPLPDEEGGPTPGSLDLSKHFPANTGSVLRLIEVDLSDPDNLRIVSNLYISGDLVNARLIDGVARVVLRSLPTGLAFKSPEEFVNWELFEDGGVIDGEDTSTSTSATSGMGTDSGELPPDVTISGTSGNSGTSEGAVGFREGEPADPWEVEWAKASEQAKLYNLAIIESSNVDDWLPQFVLEDLSQGAAKITKGRLLDCADVRHAGSYSGLSTLSVLTVDLAQSLALGKGVGVFSDGETVYASKANLYVTTTPWLPEQWSEADVGTGLKSYVHKFSLASAEQANYVASGEVRGRIRSQWSLSEHNGDLRLATTDQQGWDSQTSESFVTVLRQDGDELNQIGQVGGLGLTEEIQGVRFIGDAGYVVTFRQTDPLYAIDLSDPTKPAAVGELKIPGFSAYLHPVGDGLLLGVGYDGTDEGQLLGLQLSLFDVSDLKAPKRIQQAALGESFGWSEATFDHKAFLYWGKSKLAVVPTESYSYDELTNTETHFSGALGYTIDAEAGILPVGQIQHTPVIDPEFAWTPPIRRSMVIGDQILTLSELGLKASLLSDLSDAAWLEF
ncbi:MAG: beta-propeller domain-containing protein [Nannocystis sp.]|nr:beta-propeller domain-containing protein [Nannocystis sp.]MBA3546311.1 beta-propeller domain-containing protein [Nannocystis sp.]